MLISRPGDQKYPLASGDHVAFVDLGVATGEAQLWYARLGPPLTYDVVYASAAANAQVVGSPDLSQDRLAWRIPDWVNLRFLAGGTSPDPIPAAGVGRVVVSPTLVVWEQDGAGGPSDPDVGWAVTGARGVFTAVLPRPGAQRAIAVAWNWIAFVDATDGAVHLLDVTAYSPPAVVGGLAGGEIVVDLGTKLGTGSVSEVAIHAAAPGAAPRLAVVHDAGGYDEIGILTPGTSSTGAMVWSPAGFVETPTRKSNLHMFGDWVAFDDLSIERSVRLVNWRDPHTFAPTWRGNAQTLSYIEGSDTEMKLVWTEAGLQQPGDGLDVWQLVVALPLSGGGGGGGAVTCDTPDIVPIGLLELKPVGGSHPHDEDGDRDDEDGDRDGDHDGDHDDADHDGDHDDGDHDGDHEVRPDDRADDGWHLREIEHHDPRWHGDRVWRAWGAAPIDYSTFDPAKPRRVLVCIDATDVASAWIGVGAEVVASPTDFSAGTVSLSAGLTIPPGDHDLGAVVIARKGGSLRIRVLDDPGGDVNGPPEGSTCSARGDCPPPPRGVLAKLGCGSSGGAAGLLSLLLVGMLVARPARRRSRS